MSHFNALLSERLSVAAVIDPMDGATTARNSGRVNMALYDKLAAVVLAGALTGTLDAKLRQAKDSDGTDEKDIAGKAITQLAATDDDVQAVINLRADELDIQGGFTHVRLVVTPTGGTTNLLAAVLLAGDAKNAPVEQPAAVAEVVS